MAAKPTGTALPISHHIIDAIRPTTWTLTTHKELAESKGKLVSATHVSLWFYCRFSSTDNYANNFSNHQYNATNTNERSSQESSPMGTPFPKRIIFWNVKFKNVRNYNNLYEE